MGDAQTSFDFASRRKVWSVTALLAHLKQTIERECFDVWIEGEVSNFHQAASRHCYFTLKDGRGQLKAALFAPQARYLRFQLRDGLQVLVRGRLSLYESRGELQCYVEHVEPLGHGSLQLAFEQLKQTLAAEGLFASARKRPLPRLPRRIGLVTSPRGAAIADMVRILQRRYSNIELLLYPVQVQGQAAAEEICRALDYFADLPPGHPHQADVLIVGRGGGSIEDLWPFNDERVARALARSPVPTISAVGHETDFTIADFVADVRAPTPSAAAEIVIRPKQDLLQECAATARHLQQAIRYRLLHQGQRLARVARHRAFHALRIQLGQRAQAVDEAEHRLERAMSRRLATLDRRLAIASARVRQCDAAAVLARLRPRLAAAQLRLDASWTASQLRRRHRLEALTAMLEERNPLRILQRGYALVYDGEGRLATVAAAFRPGDLLRLRLATGWLEAEVSSTPKI